jgi:hypothetical protein
MSYFTLWGRWLSGDSVQAAELLGITILCWGRIGKVLQFVSGLTVVLDLIGSQRLSSWNSASEREFDRATSVAFTAVRNIPRDYHGTFCAAGGTRVFCAVGMACRPTVAIRDLPVASWRLKTKRNSI